MHINMTNLFNTLFGALILGFFAHIAVGIEDLKTLTSVQSKDMAILAVRVNYVESEVNEIQQVLNQITPLEINEKDTNNVRVKSIK